MKDEVERDSLQNYLKEQEIPKLCKKVLELPMHPHMKDEEIEFIVGQILSFLKEYRDEASRKVLA